MVDSRVKVCYDASVQSSQTLELLHGPEQMLVLRVRSSSLIPSQDVFTSFQAIEYTTALSWRIRVLAELTERWIGSKLRGVKDAYYHRWDYS